MRPTENKIYCRASERNERHAFTSERATPCGRSRSAGNKGLIPRGFAARENERSEFLQYRGACPTEPLLYSYHTPLPYPRQITLSPHSQSRLLSVRSFYIPVKKLERAGCGQRPGINEFMLLSRIAEKLNFFPFLPENGKHIF